MGIGTFNLETEQDRGVSRLFPNGCWRTYITEDGLTGNWLPAIAVEPHFQWNLGYE